MIKYDLLLSFINFIAGPTEYALCFIIVLQYIGTDLSYVYSNWNRKTNTTLLFHGGQWVMQALREYTRFRFGIGWHQFTVHNHLSIDQQLLFIYVGDYTFQLVMLH